MLDFFRHLFDTTGFPPRWQCGSWTPGHGWLHIVSDLGVWSAYFAIPCILGFFVLRRPSIPFRLVFVLFGAFILACGTTHLMEAVIFWWPAYRLAGLIKLFTAVVSWGTIIALVPVVPRALAMRTPEELEREIEERKRAEEHLRAAQTELERRVAERTAELARANDGLRREVEQRRQAEQGLQQAHDELEERVRRRTAELTEANVQLHQEAAERLAAVEALRRSEAMFQGLFEQAPDAILVSDQEGRIRQINNEVEQKFGYERAELVGQRVELLIPARFHTTHRNHVAHYHAAPRTRPMSENRELFARRKDGTEFPVYIMLAPLETPEELLTLSTIHDISHRKAYESVIKVRARQQAALAEFGRRALATTNLDALLDEAVALVAQTLDAECGRFVEQTLGKNELIVRAAWGWDLTCLGRELPNTENASEAAYCLALGQPVIVPKVADETRFTPSPGLRQQGVVSGIYVAITGKARAYGVLDVHARQPRCFTAEDVVFTQTFANLLATVLDRNQAEQLVQSSLAEKEVLLKEVHHRVKNNLQVISSLLELQSGHAPDGQAAEMFREGQNRIRSMALIHERLYRSSDLGRVDFAAYVQGLADHLFQTYRVSADSVRLDIQADAGLGLPIDVAVPCALLLNELLSNCLKHAFKGSPRGIITVSLRRHDDNRVELTVADDGIGLPQELNDLPHARSFGLQLVGMLADQLRGTLVVARDNGTTMRLTFPLPRFGTTSR